MVLGRPMPPLVLSDDKVQPLRSIVNSRSMPHSIVLWMPILLARAAAQTNTAMGSQLQAPVLPCLVDRQGLGPIRS